MAATFSEEAGFRPAALSPEHHKTRRSALLDNAMIAIERDNPSLKNTLPKDHTRPHLDKQSLGGVIDLISTTLTPQSNVTKLIGRCTSYRSKFPPRV
jgi:type I restriction enzyme M protein